MQEIIVPVACISFHELEIVASPSTCSYQQQERFRFRRAGVYRFQKVVERFISSDHEARFSLGTIEIADSTIIWNYPVGGLGCLCR